MVTLIIPAARDGPSFLGGRPVWLAQLTLAGAASVGRDRVRGSTPRYPLRVSAGAALHQAQRRRLPPALLRLRL